jgi:hypothetical protein
MAILCWAAKNSLRGTYIFNKVTDEKSSIRIRIRIRWSKVRIRLSVTKCQVSGTLQFIEPLLFIIATHSSLNCIYIFYDKVC